MCTIQFQGICYFKRTPAAVTVYLPVADDHSHHPDERAGGPPARSHYARLFVRNDEEIRIKTSSGFMEQTWTQLNRNGSTETANGWSLPLARKGSHSWKLSVDNVGSAPPDQTELDAHLISFRKFAKLKPDGQPPNFDPDRVVASLRATAGTFTCDPMKSHDWHVSLALRGNGGRTTFKKPAWNVRWNLGGDAAATTRISVKRGTAEEWIEIPKGKEPTIILGNLDSANAASWPLREPMPAGECEDKSGRIRGPSNKNCYDNDFKWFYRFLKDSHPSSIARLPVPYANNVNLVGYDTPTCFPGGD